MIADVTTDCGMCSEGGIPSRFHVFYATHHLVSPDSFQALGIHLVEGRRIRLADRSGAERVAVVNRALAQRHFQRSGAIGRRMIVGDDKAWYTVVGIVDDAAAWGFGSQFQPRFTVYLSILQHPAAAAELLVRASGGRTSVALSQPETVAMLGSLNVRITETSVSRRHQQEAAPVACFGRWIATQGWATMLIAAVGMFAVMRIWVRSLLPEMGLRRGVGATRTRVVLLVLRQAAGVAATGVAAGCWFGWSVWNVLPTILRGSATWETGAVASAALPLVLATFAGALLPALRVVRRSPADLLSSTG
jgi:predicted lysophospholipase L1 biosynthesis ABC-type transport system permease subunit